MWEALAAIAAVLGALAGIIKWLLDKYFIKQEELEAVKKRYADIALENLRDTVDEHKKELRTIKTALDSSTAALVMTDKEIKNLTENVRVFIDRTDVKIKAMESQVIKLSEELYLFKGTNNAKKSDQ